MTEQNENTIQSDLMKKIEENLKEIGDKIKTEASREEKTMGLIGAAMQIGVDPLSIVLGGFAAMASIHKEFPLTKEEKEEMYAGIDEGIKLLKELIN